MDMKNGGLTLRILYKFIKREIDRDRERERREREREEEKAGLLP